MPNKIDAETLAGFVEEVRGYLPQILSAVEQFRADPSRTAEIETAHRHVHTIRGAAALVGQDEISRMVDEVEEALAAVVSGQLPLDDDALRLFRETFREVERCLDEQVARHAAPPAEELSGDDLDELFARFEKPAEPEPEPAPVAPPPDEDDTEGVAPELAEVFALEAEDHLRALTSLLPVLQREPENKEVVQQIRRSAHTLKGSAAMVGFRRLTQLAHRMEDLLDLLHDGGLPVTPEIVQLLLGSTDVLHDLAAGKGDPETLQTLYTCYDELLGTGEAPAPRPAPAPAAEPAEAPTTPAAADRFLRVPVERLDEMVKLVGEMVIHRSGFEQRLSALVQQLTELRASVERLRRVSNRLETQYEAGTLGGRFPGRASGLPHSSFILPPSSFQNHGFDDLEFDRYTEFHLLSRQLAETAGDLQTISADLAHRLGDCEGLLSRQGRLTTELEDRLRRLRMLPFSTLADRLQRTVRTVAGQRGKEVTLVLEGEATELDRSVLEQLADPLLHLLRNAVDHGIEPPDVREAAGKPRCGTVRVRAARDGGQVVLTVGDDGAGVDPERVWAAAVAKGFFSEEEAATLSAEELRELLFQPGFSTAREVSEVSGRGVGLDVVKVQVDRLEGSLRLDSEPGRGARFTVRLPLTLALARAVLVRANQETWAVPLDAVRLIGRLEPDAVQQRLDGDVIRVSGEMLPLVRLGQCLNLKRPAEEGPRPPLLVLNAGFATLAVVVDQVLGAREVVVKSLGSHLRRVRGVAGATVLGDGRVVLIVNPAELDRAADRKPQRLVRPRVHRGPPQALVVDDSPSVRRVATDLLTKNGWTASAARDGLEALEKLEGAAALPDVVLLDVEMPRMDGYELLAALKAEPKYRHIPVVMVTSRAADKHRQKALDLGAAGYLIKPFQEEELLGLAARLAGREAVADLRPATTPA